WRRFAGLLGHRGWECHLVDVRGVGGGLAARAAALADYVGALPAPAVLVGHDAGGLAALGAPAPCRGTALVMLAPVAPGSPRARALALSVAALLALLRSRPVPPPAGRRATLLNGDLPPPERAEVQASLGPEDADVVRDVLWGRMALARAPGVPTL